MGFERLLVYVDIGRCQDSLFFLSLILLFSFVCFRTLYVSFQRVVVCIVEAVET